MSIRITADFSTETLYVIRAWQDILSDERETYNQDFSIQQGCHAESKLKAMQTKVKRVQHQKPVLQKKKMLKSSLNRKHKRKSYKDKL